MKIPPFDHNNVLPPFQTDPTEPTGQSPYPCDILEFCRHFASTPERCELLRGFLQFRLDCVAHGIKGKQWVDGSFVESIEESEQRAPRDIDVVTLFTVAHPSDEQLLMDAFPEFAIGRLSKAKYHVDQHPVLINGNPFRTVEVTKYWSSLFSHNRRGVWKGMVEIELYDTPDKDMEALAYLDTL